MSLSTEILLVPEHWPPRHNACTDACDMIQGPCACGAWHYLDEEWVLYHLELYGVKRKEVRHINAGGRLERRAVSTKIRRMMREEVCNGTATDVLQTLLDWVKTRSDRYDKRPGGLGRSKKK